MYDLRVLVGDNPIAKYYDKSGNVWVEARKGSAFKLRIKNDSWKRILAVISCDGINVINGKHEDFNTAPGYIINSNSSTNISGWRISGEEVKEFYFTINEDSYSKKIGVEPGNIGVIAAAIFIEQDNYNYTYTTATSWPRYKEGNPNILYRCSSSNSNDPVDVLNINCAGNVSLGNPNPNNVLYLSSVQPEEKVAVGSGNKLNDRSHKVYFGDRILQTVLTIYYDTRDNLVKKGIIDPYSSSLPKPFPNHGEYCPNI